MKVLRDPSGNYPDCLSSYISFEDYENLGDDDTILFYGAAAVHNKELIDDNSDYKTKIYYQEEHPSGLHTIDHESNIKSMKLAYPFDVVYSNCPYTVDWLNEVEYKTEKYKLGSFILNEKYVPTKNNGGFNIHNVPKKIKDVCYWGHLLANKTSVVENIVKEISKFNYEFCSLGLDAGSEYYKYLTGHNLNRLELWQRMRQCKIMVIQNLLYLDHQEVENVKRLPEWEKNKCFTHLDLNIIPQIKTRAFEAAFNKTLMLVKKDPWNVIEHWFEPDVDFVYYDNEETLGVRIKEILNDWEKYSVLTENAFNKAMSNYTTKHLVNKMIKENC